MVVGRRALNIEILIRRCYSSKTFYSKSSCQTKSSSRRNLSVTVQEPTIPQRVAASSIQAKMTSPQMRRKMKRGLLSLHSRLLRGRLRGSTRKRRKNKRVSAMQSHVLQSGVVIAMPAWDMANTNSIHVIRNTKTAKLDKKTLDTKNSRALRLQCPALFWSSSAI